MMPPNARFSLFVTSTPRLMAVVAFLVGSATMQRVSGACDHCDVSWLPVAETTKLHLAMLQFDT